MGLGTELRSYGRATSALNPSHLSNPLAFSFHFILVWAFCSSRLLRWCFPYQNCKSIFSFYFYIFRNVNLQEFSSFLYVLKKKNSAFITLPLDRSLFNTWWITCVSFISSYSSSALIFFYHDILQMKKIEEVTNYQNVAFLCSFSSVFTLSPCPSERKVLALVRTFSQSNPNSTTENTDWKQHLEDTSCSDFLIYSSQHHNYMLWNNSTPSPMLYFSQMAMQ